MNDEYEVNEAMLKKYHSITTQLLTGFDKLSKNDNTRADAPSKLASSIIIEQRGNILLEPRDTPSYNMPQVYPSKGVLYKKGFSHLLLRCLTLSEAKYVMREIHEGICDDHLGGRLVTQKVFKQGYYWPTFQKDAHQLVRTCDSCQRYAKVQPQRTEPLQVMSSL
ncbi:rve domain-containing protein/RVT_3 domain-containing protein [Gossypium australe]|uniref:Rve domain-containing protein/RVT_3 domain-containing protein n=1 Tax=Gossypium australe TaxID=47621 RepID=A0A5B6W6D8_9ROSI|nr:rve domain-containing protein/RVT_3 domain-containing protein [Gossypium australe]